MICRYCAEPVEEWERHPDFLDPVHHACGFRMVSGSVAHLAGRCSCFDPSSMELDPPGMTLRQGAEAALEYFRKHKQRCEME